MNYNNGKIYEIIGGGKCYIGSTTEKLSRRLTKHKSNKKAYEVGKREWTSCYELLDLADCKIVLIEDYPCNSKEELRAREGYYIKTKDCINKVIAGRTIKEWRQDNPEKVKMHYEKRKDKVKCDCGSMITKWNIARHKKSCNVEQ